MADRRYAVYKGIPLYNQGKVVLSSVSRECDIQNAQYMKALSKTPVYSDVNESLYASKSFIFSALHRNRIMIRNGRRDYLEHKLNLGRKPNYEGDCERYDSELICIFIRTHLSVIAKAVLSKKEL